MTREYEANQAEIASGRKAAEALGK